MNVLQRNCITFYIFRVAFCVVQQALCFSPALLVHVPVQMSPSCMLLLQMKSRLPSVLTVPSITNRTLVSWYYIVSGLSSVSPGSLGQLPTGSE